MKQNKKPALLGVNIDHIATIRQARGTNYPNLVEIALLLEQKKVADSITVHLREDRRHIQDADVVSLKQKLKIRLNLEMAPTTEMLDIAIKIKPHSVCLVPEKRQELTTEGGLDIISASQHLKPYIDKLQQGGIMVSLFIEPCEKTIQTAKDLQADIIEIHTGKYAELSGESQTLELQKIKNAVNLSNSLGLITNLGHGLTVENVQQVAAISGINEFNIGHAIVADALTVGMVQATQNMKNSIITAEQSQ